MAAARPPFEITGRHVAWAMAAFFSSILLANAALAVIAIRSFPGEDEKRSYVQGLRYNERLAERRAQAALGWRADVEIIAPAGAPVVELRLFDREGRPLPGVSITADLRRPATDREDRALVFREVGPGLYRADAAGLGPGDWRLLGEARRGETGIDIARRLTWRSSTPSR